MGILVLNAGSSTLKYAVYDDRAESECLRGLIELDRSVAGNGLREAVGAAIQQASAQQPLIAVGHRIVHGGQLLRDTTRVSTTVLDQLQAVEHLAPLHNPSGRAALMHAMELLPKSAHFTAFDTAFFSSLPEYAWRYALPASLADRLEIRRFGFHGISHRYVMHQAANVLERPVAELRLITLHLGNGASACAINNGEPVDISMGMTPLEGLVMGTRAGDLDPAIPGILRREGFADSDVEEILQRGAGLKGLCGSADMREIRQRHEAGDAQAQLTLAIVRHRLVKYLGAYYALLGGVDAIVFTGGIGENDASLRSEVITAAKALGCALDTEANRRHAARISPHAAAVAVLCLPTNEEWAIAQTLLPMLSEARSPT